MVGRWALLFGSILANCQLAIWQAGISAQSARNADSILYVQLIGDRCTKS
jgi:hypothetical protein